jgi:CRISPR-associated exonuclease Cas4
LFYGRPRRRTAVAFDAALRQTTADAAARLHELIRSGVTPRARREPKCDSCSLLSLCLPTATAPRRSAAGFTDRQFRAVLESDGPVALVDQEE